MLATLLGGLCSRNIPQKIRFKLQFMGLGGLYAATLFLGRVASHSFQIGEGNVTRR